MTTDELNETLENLLHLLDTYATSGALHVSLVMAAEAMADQLRYRASGSPLANSLRYVA